MTARIVVTVEHTPKKAFATAADWPGWSRSGKTEDAALAALATYGRRYGAIATLAGQTFEDGVQRDELDVVERVTGSAGTDYGVPSRPTDHDARPTSAAEAGRLADLVAAAWSFFDGVAAAAPEDLRKGPRGGGRNTSKVVAHVMDADRAYAAEMGIKIAPIAAGDTAAGGSMRAAMLETIRAARDGSPLAGRRWPARYAAHRIAWHALDHAWEIEDRTD